MTVMSVDNIIQIRIIWKQISILRSRNTIL